MKKTLKSQIAVRVRTILKEKGLKQQDLADLSGLTKSYVSLILSGSLNLTLDTLEILEKALKERIITIP